MLVLCHALIWLDEKHVSSMYCMLPRGHEGEHSAFTYEETKAFQEAFKKPLIVCLCGSTRFKDMFIKANTDETDAGHIVLSVGRFVPQAEQVLGIEKKAALDELHKRKIDLADEILVLNVDGYIGSSTRSDINYALAHKKRVRYLEAL